VSVNFEINKPVSQMDTIELRELANTIISLRESSTSDRVIAELAVRALDIAMTKAEVQG